MFDEDFKEEEISISEIVSKLKEASDAYYNGSEPIISDEEFDNLKDNLKSIDPKNPFLFQIGSAVEVSSWKKEKHKIPMGSLNKVNTNIEFINWAEGVECSDFVVMTKLDGISIDLEYSKGNLIKAITRGDGTIGEDIFSNVIQMKNVETELEGFTGSLRGEIVIHKDDFVLLNKESENNGDRVYKNPRNAASGIAKAYDGVYARFCTILYYDITSDAFYYEWERQKIECIIDLELEPCWWMELSNIESIEKYKEFEKRLREEYPYEIDGLVVVVNDCDDQRDLGFVYDNPKGKIAWKFGAIQKETIIEDVEWQIGLNRRITPVAKLRPVLCAGVTIENATIHNIEIFKSMKVGKGDRVVISRRGDVIPYLEKVVERVGKKFEYPKQCPSCKADTEIDGKFLICPNDGCDALYLGNLQKWIDKLEIMGISYSIIEKLYRAKKINVPSDFYYLKVEDFIGIDGLGEKSGNKILEQLKSKSEIDLPTFIGGLNMSSFSSSLCERLINSGYDSIDALLKLNEETLCKIPGIKEKIAKKIVKGLNSKFSIINKLLITGIKIKKIEREVINMASDKLKTMSFVFTGAIQKNNPKSGDRYTRQELQKMVVENGGENHSTVKKGTTFLVQADPSSQSTKTKKAIQVGTKILSEADFFKLIGKD